MHLSFVFFFNSLLLGLGLAMDAFSVSLANGLAEPDMKKRKMSLIAGTFGFFQAFMPMLGWVCVHTVVRHFKAFELFVPWIALVLLLFIGGKMLLESMINTRKGESDEGADPGRLSPGMLVVQGVATSIDALSVGFTISNYGWLQALFCAMIIAFVTYFISLAGLLTGRRVGVRLSNKAGILGGCILIFIGLEIFLTGAF